MKQFQHILWFSVLFLALSSYAQQNEWPKTLKTSEGTEIRLYEPVPESYSGNVLKVRSAVSMIPQGKTDPVFGVLWGEVTTETEGAANIGWRSIAITHIKFPGETDQTGQDALQAAIEKTLPGWNISISRETLQVKLNASQKEATLAANLNADPPTILFKKQSSILVLIDGEPDLQKNADWGVDQVVNTPFTIIRNSDRRFYLYGDKKWYSATSVTGNWNHVERMPASLSRIDQEVRASDTSGTTSNDVAEIIVSTEPAELIQSDGEPNFAPVEGTDLLYMTNTGNDVFMDIRSQQYYVLISGRWYASPDLSRSWTYTAPDQLPADFAKIPEGSAKSNVLASVAGTGAANESVMEAQMPQMAKVDRDKATASVTYDGDPQFEAIEGTGLQYAVNSPGSVLNDGRKYYYVENGVWFESYNASGPWKVAVQRPFGVENIPPTYPVYNVKYVYIYDVMPGYVYMGYTPGYLGNYIYGPTIVYGTGHYYRPWRGRYYYPRPLTWGFNMRYNPWIGWGFGIRINAGWFFLDRGNYRRASCWGGWWGPPVYRPPYYRSYNYYYGRTGRVNNYVVINRNNNIYRYRRDVVTYDRPRYAYNADRRSGSYGDRYGNNGYNNNNRYSNTNNRYNNNNVPQARNRQRDLQPPAGNSGNRPVTRPYNPSVNQQRIPDGNRNFPSGTDNGGIRRRSAQADFPQSGGNRINVPDGEVRNRGTENSPSGNYRGGVRRPSAQPDFPQRNQGNPNTFPQPEVRRRENPGFPSGGDNGGVQRPSRQIDFPRRSSGGNNIPNRIERMNTERPRAEQPPQQESQFPQQRPSRVRSESGSTESYPIRRGD